jgi:DNA-directed RNA polymerase specialized sigma24 family protein
MTAKRQTAIELIDLEGMDIKTAAEKMGISYNSLRKLYHDAKLDLKRRLIKIGLWTDVFKLFIWFLLFGEK